MQNPLTAARWVKGVFGSDKSFRQNPILGNARLNEMGLHSKRVQIAADLATRRRARMAKHLDAKDVKALETDGYVLKHPAIPEDVFKSLQAELLNTPLPTREFQQGPTTTRMGALTMDAPLARRFAANGEMHRLMGYAAGRQGPPVVSLQTVIAEAAKQDPDPQTHLHSDTFHSTAKMWLFLEDVREDEGPFVYVPGSHQLTPQRLDWEYAQSLTAKDDPRLHHSLGSFRLSEAELPALGYGAPKQFTVKANTMIIANTYGFHHRQVSARKTTRIELHGNLRENPFVPWNGLNVKGLPGIAENQISLWFKYLSWRERRGKTGIWKDLGRVTPR